MKDPLSTLSNIAYLILAGVVAFYDPTNQLLIGSLVFLAAASFLHHYGGAEKGTPYHKADEAGIYVVMGTLIIQVLGLSGLCILAAFLGLGILVMRLDQADLFKWTPALSVAVIAGLWVGYGFSETMPVIAAALISAWLRLRGENTDQRHAMWHVVSAVGLWLAWEVMV